MAYVKVTPPSVVYHLTRTENLDSILDDGKISRFMDSECWFCESLGKMKAYMEQTVMCEGKPYYNVTGQLCRYPKFVPEDYVLLKLTPCGYEDNWYRWNQEIPPGSPKELARAAREFSLLKIGYRGDMAFKEPEVIDVPKFLSGEIVSHKELTSSEMWGLIFERTEAEMAAHMRGLDQLEWDELIQSAAEISAMQVCRGRLTVQGESLPREELQFLLQAERPLEVLREAWLEHQSVDEGEIFSSLLSGLREETQRMESPTMQMK